MATKSERVVAQATEIAPVSAMYGHEIINTLIFGFVIGIVFAGAYYLLNQFVFGSVLCRAGNDATCSSAPTYSMAVATVIAAIVGLVGLVQLRGYRPLIVVLAVAVSLWGFEAIFMSVPWIVGLLSSAVLFALSYLLFSWIARLRSVALATVVTIVLVVLIRLALVS